jgi:putative MFS transporter
MVSFLGAALPLLLLAWLSRAGPAPIVTVVWFASISLFFMSILLASIYVYLPEIYPTPIRALGSGTASAFLRLASIVGPTIVGAILAQSGVAVVFLFFALVGLAGGLVVFVFAIETRGKILEEIAQ